MKIFHWGMINPITRAPFSFDDPNVQWGDPGFYLEPEDPGFVPYPGHVAGSESQALDEWAMQPSGKITDKPAAPAGDDVFTCDAAGSSSDDFSVSLCSDAESGDSTMDAAVADITGIPPEKCAEILGAYLDQLLACASGSGLAQGIHDLLSICPSSGRRLSGKDGSRTLSEALGEAANTRHLRRF